MTEAEKVCDCPKPCDQAVYEPSLSYATLSSISVDKILTANSDQLRMKFDKALETRQRVEGNTFIVDILMFRFVLRNYTSMRKFAREYLGEEDSLFFRTVTAAQNMVRLFQEDQNTLLGDVTNFIDAYNFYYLDTRNLYLALSKELRRSLSELDQLLYMTSSKGKIHDYLSSVLADSHKQTRFLKETIGLMEVKLKNTTFAAESYRQKNLAKWLPQKFIQNTDICSQHMRQSQTVLNDLRDLVTKMETYASRGSASSLRNTQGTFRTQYTSYKETDEQLKQCLEEYTALLYRIKEGLAKHQKSADELANQEGFVYNYTQEIETISVDNEELENAVKLYEKGELGKRGILQTFIPAESPNEMANNITKFTERITRISETLRKFIGETMLRLKSSYKEVLLWAAEWSLYIDSNHLYDSASRMKLWKLPKANLENPAQREDEGRELWKIWDRNTDISEFVEKYADQYVNEAIESKSKGIN